MGLLGDQHREIIRGNEIKGLKLIGHYKSEINAQTDLVTKLESKPWARVSWNLSKYSGTFEIRVLGSKKTSYNQKRKSCWP